MPKGYDGLRKRCGCPPGKWARCRHEWQFYRKLKGREYRESLHRRAGLAADQVMSKTEAEGWRDKLRDQIRDGTYRPIGTPDPEAIAKQTVDDVLDRYVTDHVNKPGRRPGAKKNMESHIRLLRTTAIKIGRESIPFGALAFRDITEDTIEALREARRHALRAAGERAATAKADTTGTLVEPRIQPLEKQGEVGINRMLARLRHVFTYAVRKKIVAATPFRKGDVTMVQLATEFERGRTRRLASGEEAKLLHHANDHLRGLITAALETGCRLGELLGLRWSDVLWTDERKPTMKRFQLAAERTKTARTRTLPISARLRAVLEMRRHVPEQYRKLTGRDEYPADAHIFGNEVGQRVQRVTRAWAATVLRAHGQTPEYTKTHALAAKSREHLRKINLHFHDLRREFASRMMESGGTLHEVQAWLGHASITMTARYLGVTDAGLQRSLDRFETMRPWVDDDEKRTNGAHGADSASPHLPESPSELPANLLN
jgi:integrase